MKLPSLDNGGLMNAVRLPLKPISTNRMWIGRKIKTKIARQFEVEVARHLAEQAKPCELPDGDLTLHCRFGVTRQSDVSNCVKLLEDCIARHYGFDDRRFAGHTAVRVPAKRGEEFIVFVIEPYRESDFPSLIGQIK